MTLFVYAVVACSALVFVAATAVRAARYARAPLHLRWELYPVPHEAPHLAAHGGSYLENGEWWRVPRRVSLAGELRAMVPEMLFLNGLRRANPRLWLRSFPFHVGLYLLAGGLTLLVACAVAGLVGQGRGALGVVVLPRLGGATGGAGLVLATCGACALLHRRLVDPGLRAGSTPADFFNLLFFAAALTAAGVGYLARPAASPDALAIATGLLTWDTTVPIPASLVPGLLACAMLVAYVPLTHMSHFVGKFFTYHAVRWNDRPLLDDPAMAERFAEYLAYRPAWAAPHIKDSRARTWAEVASSNPVEGKR